MIAEKFKFTPVYKASKYGAFVNGSWTDGVVREVNM